MEGKKSFGTTCQGIRRIRRKLGVPGQKERGKRKGRRAAGWKTATGMMFPADQTRGEAWATCSVGARVGVCFWLGKTVKTTLPSEQGVWALEKLGGTNVM